MFRSQVFIGLRRKICHCGEGVEGSWWKSRGLSEASGNFPLLCFTAALHSLPALPFALQGVEKGLVRQKGLGEGEEREERQERRGKTGPAAHGGKFR